MTIHPTVFHSLIDKAADFRGQKISGVEDFKRIESFVEDMVQTVTRAVDTTRAIEERKAAIEEINK